MEVNKSSVPEGVPELGKVLSQMEVKNSSVPEGVPELEEVPSQMEVKKISVPQWVPSLKRSPARWRSRWVLYLSECPSLKRSPSRLRSERPDWTSYPSSLRRSSLPKFKYLWDRAHFVPFSVFDSSPPFLSLPPSPIPVSIFLTLVIERISCVWFLLKWTPTAADG